MQSIIVILVENHMKSSSITFELMDLKTIDRLINNFLLLYVQLIDN